VPVNSINGQDGNVVLTRTLPDLATVDAVSSLSPTITLTNQSTSTIVSAQPLIAPDTGPFNYTAQMGFGASFPDTTLYQPVSRYPYSWGSPPYWSTVFGTDAQVFEFLFKYVSASTLYRVSVDNRKLTDLMTSTGASAVGSRHVLKFDLGSSAPRKIRIDGYTMPFGGVFVGPNDSVWRVPFAGKRIMVTGDSLSAGSSFNTGAGAGTWFHRFCRILGYEDTWNTAIGGTGYIADNSGSSVTMGARVTDVTGYAPDRIICWAGYNDNGQPAASTDAAARAYFRQLASALDAYTVIIGCWSPTGSPAGSLVTTDETLRQAAADFKMPFISPITGKVYNADGLQVASLGAWITSANASRFVNSSDNIHPTDAGHAYLARRIAEAYALLGNV
jgi:lysophospholipase L1-like esterase